MNENRELSIIFVNYKSSKLLDDCLKSLDQQDYKEFCVHIVDNTPGSKEYTILEKIKQKYQNNFSITLYKPKYNLGFAGGNNIALKHISTPYILLLNCDTVVKSDSILKAIRYLNEHPEIGMLSPKIMHYANPNRIWYAGARIKPYSNYFSKHIGMNQIDIGMYDRTRETDGVVGAALFTRKDLVDKIGYLDEILFMYVEETDWNQRAKKQGYKIYYLPESIIYHKVDVISKKNRLGFRDNPFQVYLYSRNRIIFMFKNYKLIEIILFFFGYQVLSAFKEFGLAILMNKYEFFIAQLRALLMGLRIGINRRYHRSCRKIILNEMKYINSFNKKSNSTIKCS